MARCVNKYDADDDEKSGDLPNQAPQMTQQLTSHVVTRWYRAPEVILRSQKREHVTAIDMWSTGCIFAELLFTIKENVKDYNYREPLFPGKTSFPQTPGIIDNNDEFVGNETWKSQHDQLNVIFEVMGAPGKDDIKNLTNKNAQGFVMQLIKRFQHKEGQKLASKFPANDNIAIDLLRKCLKFDPSKRLTAQEALKHPYFDEIRDPQIEARLPFEKFDFEDIELDVDMIKELIIKEIKYYQTKRQSLYFPPGQALIDPNEIDEKQNPYANDDNNDNNDNNNNNNNNNGNTNGPTSRVVAQMSNASSNSSVSSPTKSDHDITGDKLQEFADFTTGEKQDTNNEQKYAE